MNDNLLEIHGLTKYYSGVKALDDVSFSVRRGEMHAICGENGAGKSTLIKILTGAVQPTRGRFVFDGVEYTSMTPRKSIDAGIKAIYQEFTLVPYLSVADNIFFGREPANGIVRDIRRTIDETRRLCESFGISLDPKAKVESLGTAEQQIVEILKAVSQSAKLFIMDEPTASLTVNETRTFFEIIARLREQGATIIYISHRLEEVFQLCERVSILTDGKYVVTRETKDVNRAQLIAYMVGRDLVDSYPAGEPPGDEVILRVQDLRNARLKGATFSLRRGEILGFGGLVGAGRTELARAIFGADPLTSGAIELRQQEYRPTTPAAALRAGIGLIPEDRKHQGLIMEQSVRYNVSISILKRLERFGLWLNKPEESLYSQKYIRELRIKTPGDFQEAKNLSGGNQQKVVLAKMLAVDCDILIFDEPTRGIDVGAKQEIYALMRAIVAQGKSIIMISSDMPELIGMSDRMVVMSNGYTVGELRRDEYSQERILDLASSGFAMEPILHE